MEQVFRNKAFLPENSRGRKYLEPPGSLEGISPLEIDIERISKSQAFVRQENKTQVIYPANGIYSTRMTHSLDMAKSGLYVGHRLGLNLQLLQALTLIHDVGHVAFGPYGQRFASEKLGEKFRHENFGPFVVQEIEPLNLTYEVLEGITYHSISGKSFSLGHDILCLDVLRVLDKISINRDAYQLANFKGLKLNLPKEHNLIGKNEEEAQRNLLSAFCDESISLGKISFEYCKQAKYFNTVKTYMYEEVYRQLDEVRENTLREPLEKIYDFFTNLGFPNRKAILTMALMTENEMFSIIRDLSFSRLRTSQKMLNYGYQIAENLEIIEAKYQMDFLAPDLSWAK
ncbi:MAG: HD domain-containing protein [Patescibacteria group bacterium]